MTKRRKTPAKKAGIAYKILPAKEHTKTIQFSSREKDPEKVKEVLASIPTSQFNSLLYGDKQAGEHRSKPPGFVVAVIGVKNGKRIQYYTKVLKEQLVPGQHLFTPLAAKRHLINTVDLLITDSHAADELLSADEDYEDDNEHALLDDDTKDYLKGIDPTHIVSVSLKVVYQKPGY